MAGVHTSFLQLYDALPEELKLKILGYALRQDDPIDRQTASGFLDGRAQPLLSPKFKDAEIAKEAFYQSNTFLVVVSVTGIRLPPARYHRFIRHLHICIFPQKQGWKMLSTLRIKALFQKVRDLTIIVDCELTLCRHPRCRCNWTLSGDMPLHKCWVCKIRNRSWFLRADIPAVEFDVRKLEVEFVPAQVSESAREYGGYFALGWGLGFNLAQRLHLENDDAQEKAFAHLRIAHAQASVEESLELGGSSSITSAGNQRLLCNRRIQEVKK